MLLEMLQLRNKQETHKSIHQQIDSAKKKNTGILHSSLKENK